MDLLLRESTAVKSRFLCFCAFFTFFVMSRLKINPLGKIIGSQSWSCLCIRSYYGLAFIRQPKQVPANLFINHFKGTANLHFWAFAGHVQFKNLPVFAYYIVTEFMKA